MKKALLLLIIIFNPLHSYCQSSYKIFKKLAIGFEIGSTHQYGDLPINDIKKHFGATADYYFTPYIPIEVEIQRGKLVGSETIPPFRKFTNQYNSYFLSSRIHLGELLLRNSFNYNRSREFILNILKGGFVGAGYGVIVNNQIKIYRNSKDPSTTGLDKSKEYILPLSIGWDTSGFERRLIAGFKGQVNFIQGDNMDGYYLPNSHNDVYGTVSLTLKYRLAINGINRF